MNAKVPQDNTLCANSRYFFPVIPAKAGIQKAYFRRNAPPFFDWPPFWLKKTNWIPAFAGMTGMAKRMRNIPDSRAPSRE
jgi:hypothetical protein